MDINRTIWLGDKGTMFLEWGEGGGGGRGQMSDLIFYPGIYWKMNIYIGTCYKMLHKIFPYKFNDSSTSQYAWAINIVGMRKYPNDMKTDFFLISPHSLIIKLKQASTI